LKTIDSFRRRCIRSKCTWIIFSILIILAITIPITFILIKKENHQEKSATTLMATTATIVTTEKLLTTTESMVRLRGKYSLIFKGRLVKKHMSDIFNSFLLDLNGNKD
jgi:uncharacterized membrane protein YkgB